MKNKTINPCFLTPEIRANLYQKASVLPGVLFLPAESLLEVNFNLPLLQKAEEVTAGSWGSQHTLPNECI